MKTISVTVLVVLILSACVVGPPARRGAIDVSGQDNEAQIQAVRQILSQSVDVAVNRLGRRDGYWANPRVRIPLPEELRRVENLSRRYGLERYADEFAESLNRAAEAAMPLAKPVLFAAIRDMPLVEVSDVVHGNIDAATQYFRVHTDKELKERLMPIVSDATARTHVTSAYKRLLKKAMYLDKAARPIQQDLDAHVTSEMLDGLYLFMAEEERRIRRNPKARDTDLIRKIFP